MIVIIGAIVVTICVIGGFVMGGGHVGALWHPNELVIIGGGALGALIIMSPKKVLIDMVKGLVLCLKGAPHNREAYEEFVMLMFVLFMIV